MKDRCTGKKLNPPLFQTIKIPLVLSHVDPQIHVATPLHIYAKAKNLLIPSLMSLTLHQ